LVKKIMYTYISVFPLLCLRYADIYSTGTKWLEN